MGIRQGDIFLQYGQVYVVEQTIGRVVYLMTIGRDEVVVHDLMYFRTSVERYFDKLTI